MAHVALYYEIPIVLIGIMLVYFCWYNVTAYHSLSGSVLKSIHRWLAASGGFFFLWGAFHAVHDVVHLPEDVETILHYVVEHGFLLLSVVCLFITARYIKRFSDTFGFKGKGFQK